MRRLSDLDRGELVVEVMRLRQGLREIADLASSFRNLDEALRIAAKVSQLLAAAPDGRPPAGPEDLCVCGAPKDEHTAPHWDGGTSRCPR